MATSAEIILKDGGAEKTFRLSYYDGWPGSAGQGLLDYIASRKGDTARIARELHGLDLLEPEQFRGATELGKKICDLDGDLIAIVELGKTFNWDGFEEIDWSYTIDLDAQEFGYHYYDDDPRWPLASPPTKEEWIAPLDDGE
jgi:hypothetical protein